MNSCFFDGRVCGGDDQKNKKKLVLRVRQNRTTGEEFYICNFRFAVKARHSDEVNYIDCRLYEDRAERFVENVKAGMKLILEDCELKVEKYSTEKYGESERHVYIVNRWTFAESKIMNDKHRNMQDDEQDDSCEEEVREEKKTSSKKSNTVKSVSLTESKEVEKKGKSKEEDEWLGFDKLEWQYYLDNPDMTVERLKKLEVRYLASEEKKKVMLQKRKQIHAIMAKRAGFSSANGKDVPFGKEG